MHIQTTVATRKKGAKEGNEDRTLHYAPSSTFYRFFVDHNFAKYTLEHVYACVDFLCIVSLYSCQMCWVWSAPLYTALSNKQLISTGPGEPEGSRSMSGGVKSGE